MGLVQRELEAGGITTLTLTPVPALTGSVSPPRLVAVEHPLGYAFGDVGDKTGQMDVLRAALQAVAEIEEPGDTIHLPFKFTADPQPLAGDPPPPPPITTYLFSHPMQVKRLIRREVPGTVEE